MQVLQQKTGFRRLRIAGAATGLALLAACSGHESGSGVDDGAFGNATMTNTLVMTGQESYVHDLSTRFAAEVPSMVTFAFNSSQLDAEAQGILRRQASWIRQFPEVRFRVYGHTDLVGSSAYNKSLGLRRAQAVVRYLATLGISPSRLEAVVSFGETQPLVVTEGRERRNRRTITEVSGFVAGHPSLLDGKYAQVIYREYVRSAEPATGLSGTSLSEGSGGL
ncbi:OmpA family protein [Salipiger mangrovisoli]|uniref:OmpA family protein n=1 Tax=Salipiger mangrovisoli TaxID=2865933 RepID=A0ABR9X8J4_9RHOB|nr:OmpA family protein [Salipiger mangrovisoli]MBE9639883.1 OmpA family protein [Salipiger mangrovisoli]